MQSIFPAIPKNEEAQENSAPFDWNSIFESKWEEFTIYYEKRSALTDLSGKNIFQIVSLVKFEPNSAILDPATSIKFVVPALENASMKAVKTSLGCLP